MRRGEVAERVVAGAEATFFAGFTILAGWGAGADIAQIFNESARADIASNLLFRAIGCAGFAGISALLSLLTGWLAVASDPGTSGNTSEKGRESHEPRNVV